MGEAKNGLENYCYSIRNSMNDEKLQADKKAEANQAVDEAIKWLDSNQTAEKDEFEDKLKSIEAICNPIMQAAYQAGGAGGMPGVPAGSGGPSGPNVEEVD